MDGETQLTMRLSIDALDLEGRGVARDEGKVCFVVGALPGELVDAERLRQSKKHTTARTVEVLKQSWQRVAPRCAYFGQCGGCALQHFDTAGQVAAKQRVLEDNLWHIGRVRAELIDRPIHGSPWAYRHRARMSAHYVPSRGRVLIGFRERASRYVADMRSCEVLPPAVSDLIEPLQWLLTETSLRAQIPQVELSCGENLTAVVLRNLAPPTQNDVALLTEFAAQHAIAIWLQPGEPDSARPLRESALPSYRLPEFGLEFEFFPTEFTQVNFAVNRVLVRRAIALLQPMPGEHVADLFCGLGNFSLPMARRGAAVVGVEGSARLVRRAESNAERNGLEEQCRFTVADLFTDGSIAAERFDKLLLDPPREGAVEIVKALSAPLPRRILYVSCNPATLARDAAVLVHVHGYRLRSVAVVNMFPHTGHAESIALFEI